MKLGYYSKFRLKLLVKINLLRDRENIKNYIESIMFRINETFMDDTKYSIHMQTLENINDNFLKLETKLSVFKSSKFKQYREKLNFCLEKLQNLSKNIGIKDLFTLIKLNTGINEEYFKDNELIHFLNKTVKPINCTMYNLSISNKKELVVFSNSKNVKDYDLMNMKDINRIKIRLMFNPTNLEQNVYGCRIYIPLNNSRVLVASSIVLKDSLNIIRNYNVLLMKDSKIKKSLNVINVKKDFKTSFVKQLTIRDYLVLNEDEIINMCIEWFNELSTLKQKTISAIVKLFLSESSWVQRRILTLFLMTDDNIDLQQLACLLYDMINNDSYLIKSQPLSSKIYGSLSWDIKKKIKVANKINEKYNKDSFNFNESDIPYDKRIAMMKASDYVKSKAMEKYREIVNKGSESSSKCQQYLDGILKIPFGIFKEEGITKYIDKFRETLIHELNLENKNYSSIEIDGILMNKYQDNYKKLKEIAKFINNNFDFKLKLNTKKEILLNDINETFDSLSCSQKMKLLDAHYSNNIVLNQWLKYKCERKEYIQNATNILDEAVYAQNDAKQELLRIIAQWINGEMKGYCLGFEGPPGTGKTSLAKKGISSCLKNEFGENRPFAFISLGGSSNGSVLEGHSYTYVGSTWGKIVDVLIETQCMNPIIYFDELDKISKTEHGKEIIGILTHLTDSSQNDEFYDKYFAGVKIDLSRVLFIFSYNDFTKLDPILADRIHRVKFNHLTNNDKIHIINNYLLPELLETVGFKKDNMIFPDQIIIYLIQNYTFEAGIRKLKQKIFEIIREINLKFIMGKYTKFPITITKEIIDNIFSTKPKLLYKKINNSPSVGLVNGLYATTSGIGGLTTIEVWKTYSQTPFSLEITGQQGDVMKESVKCAKTIAWNYIDNSLKKKIQKEWSDKNTWGLHIHCPEAATPKDGPSAGAAITLGIISVLTGRKVNNTIALTGEIDLNGNIHVIGGLESKIDGGKLAGVHKILYPHDNYQDIQIIEKNNKEILSNIEIVPVKKIDEIINYCLLD